MIHSKYGVLAQAKWEAQKIVCNYYLLQWNGYGYKMEICFIVVSMIVLIQLIFEF